MTPRLVTVHRPAAPVVNPDGTYQRDEHDEILYGDPTEFKALCLRVGGDRGAARSRELTDGRQTLVTAIAAVFPAHVDVRETDEITAWVGTPHAKRFRVTGVLPVAGISGAVKHLRADLEAVE